MIDGDYELPLAVVHRQHTWREKRDLLPPDLCEEQVEELLDRIEGVEFDLRAAGPEATAVILRRLAACVIIPERDDMDIAMECYLEDLQEYPEHVLVDVTQQWRRSEKFWPTIAELRKLCREHPEGVGVNRAQLRELYRLLAVVNHPAPDCMVTWEWVCARDRARDDMCRAHDPFAQVIRLQYPSQYATPQTRALDRPPRWSRNAAHAKGNGAVHNNPVGPRRL